MARIIVVTPNGESRLPCPLRKREIVSSVHAAIHMEDARKRPSLHCRMLKHPAGNEKTPRANGIHALEPFPRRMLPIRVHIRVKVVGIPVDGAFARTSLIVPDRSRASYNIQ